VNSRQLLSDFWFWCTGWTAEKSGKGEKWCTKQEFVDVEGDKELKKLGKLEAKGAKKDAKKGAKEEAAAKKVADKAKKEVRAFESKLAALVESVPDSDPHPLDPKALDFLQQAVKKIAEQTGEWEEADDDGDDAEPEPEPEK
jgi:hypothetical protein